MNAIIASIDMLLIAKQYNAPKEMIEHMEKYLVYLELNHPQWLTEAMHYLCDSEEMSIREQVEAIATHEDSEDLIDNVEGVVVWESLEGRYKCSEFLYSLIGYDK
jgi:hypothetical protein